ncbi:O-antigen polymerase [Aeromonas sp. S41-2]|uniref:O-antigen polymerase n=1 Tax=Aeromonas sp. S41-2 TaxID=2990502 RepID=UPI0022E958D3|nr:O-antigen polymerase [Aeromonas sp. S41-2]
MRLLNPFYVLVTLFSFNMFLHLFFYETYGALSLTTYVVVIVYVIAFSFGFYFLEKSIPNVKTEKYKAIISNKMNLIVLVSLVVVLAIFYLRVSAENAINFATYRQLIFKAYETKNDIYYFIRLLSLYVFFATAMFFNYSGKYMFAVWFVIVVFISIITTGRNYLLIYLLGFLIYILNGVNVKRNLCLFVFLFILTFSIFILAFDKGGDGNIFVSIIDSILKYFSIPLYGFSYMTEHVPQNNTIMLLSPGILDFIGIDYNAPPPAIYTPEPFVTNVYTLFYFMYCDLGIYGIIFFGMLYGALHKKIYLYALKGSSFSLYLYTLSLYPIFMSVFFDVYLSSLGLWVAALIPWFFIKKYRINLCRS